MQLQTWVSHMKHRNSVDSLIRRDCQYRCQSSKLLPANPRQLSKRFSPLASKCKCALTPTGVLLASICRQVAWRCETKASMYTVCSNWLAARDYVAHRTTLNCYRIWKSSAQHILGLTLNEQQRRKLAKCYRNSGITSICKR